MKLLDHTLITLVYYFLHLFLRNDSPERHGFTRAVLLSTGYPYTLEKEKI